MLHQQRFCHVVSRLWSRRVDLELSDQVRINAQSQFARRIADGGPSRLSVGAEGLTLDKGNPAVSELQAANAKDSGGAAITVRKDALPTANERKKALGY